MSISSISPAANSDPTANVSKRKTSLDQQDFFNLFITQLKNQNPLNPMDHFQMASQVAQFNSLETLNRIYQSVEIMGAYQASMNSLQAAGLIGKNVEFESQHLSVQGGRVSEGYYQLSRPGKVKIEIFDEKGQLIRTLEEGIKDGSRQRLVWDGKSQAGVTQSDGKYSVQVTAVDEKGQPIPVELSRIGAVTGIQFENGLIYLYLGSEKITLRDVKAILNPSS
jgi:flagellar basal-body rod modification protein FlgD